MSEYIARMAGVGGGFFAIETIPRVVPEFLKSYDPLAPDPDGIGNGIAEFTEDIAQAKRFASAADAGAFILQVHPTKPVRPDGRPNKPLMAYSWEFAPAADYDGCPDCKWETGHTCQSCGRVLV